MKKDKLYLIISILFVAVILIITNGFKGTYSAPESTIYWAVDGSSCTLGSSNCTLKISNNLIGGTHYKSGSFSSTKVISSYSDVPWYSYRNSIKNIQIGDEDDIISPESTAYWFHGLSYLSTIDLTYLDTSNTTNMSYMFYNCFDLTTLDLSNFNTINVTNMSYMFYSCTDLTTLDLSNFNTINVTNMSGMFYNCFDLTTLDLSNFNTINVTNMSYMFYDCRNLTTLDVSNFNTSMVTNMSYMFYDCRNLTTLDVSNFNTSMVTNMSYMFYDCRNLTTLDLSNFNTSQVTNMSYMFKYVGNDSDDYVYVDFSSFDTSKVENFSDMIDFKSEILDISTFDTTNLSMSSIAISGKHNLIKVGNKFTLELPYDIWVNADTDEIYDVSDYRKEYTIPKNVAATYIRPVAYWKIDGDTLYIKNKKLDDDYQEFNTADKLYKWISYSGNVGLAWQSDPSKIKKIIIGDKDDIVTPYNMSYWFRGIECLESLDIRYLDSSKVTSMDSLFSGTIFKDTIDLSNLNTSNVKNMSYMFNNFSMKNGILDLSTFDTSNVTNMYYMFNNVYNHKYQNWKLVGITNWNTSKVEDFRGLFSGDIPILEVDLSGWDTSSSIDDITPFSTFGGLKKITIGENWTIGLGHYSDIWISESSLQICYGDEIPLGKKDTYFMPMVFWNIKGDTLYLSNKIPSDVDYGYGYIYSTGSLTYWKNINEFWDYYDDEDYEEVDTKTIIKKVVIGGPNDIVKPVIMYSWFKGFNKIEEIDATYLDTSLVEDMSYAFATGNCTDYNDASTCTSALKKIKGIENFDLSKAINISDALSYNYSLESLDLSGWDTSNVEEMYGLFKSDISLKEIKGLENFDTSKVTLSKDMFKNTILIDEITVGDKWNIPLSNELWMDKSSKELYENGNIPKNVKATYTKPIVYWAINNDTLTISNDPVSGNVDDGKINTTKNINSQNSWKNNANKIKHAVIGDEDSLIKPYSMNEWFSDLVNLKELDLSYVDSTYLKSNYHLFNNSNSLEKINLNNINLDKNKQCMLLNEKNLYDVLDIPNFNIAYEYSGYFPYSYDGIRPNNEPDDEILCIDSLYNCEVNSNEDSCEYYRKSCSNIEVINSKNCENLYNNCPSGDLDLCENEYNKYCTNAEFSNKTCLLMKYDCEVDFDDNACNKYNNNCKNSTIDLNVCYSVLEYEDEYNYYCNNLEGNESECEDIYTKCYNGITNSCIFYDNVCHNTKLTSAICGDLFISCKNGNDSDCEIYNNSCESKTFSNDACGNALIACTYGNAEMCDIFDNNCDNMTYTSTTCDYIIEECVYDYDDDMCSLADTYCKNVELSTDECEFLANKYMSWSASPAKEYYLNNCKNVEFSENFCNNAFYDCGLYGSQSSCEIYKKSCQSVSLNSACYGFIYDCENNHDLASCSAFEKKCSYPNDTSQFCKEEKMNCVEEGDELSCTIYDKYCIHPIEKTTCDIFDNNTSLKEITVGENNINTVKASLENPNSEYIEGADGKWYDIDVNEYDVSELLNENNTYYALKPHKVSYDVDVKPQAKLIGEDLTLYDEIIKDSDTAEIITKFDTVGGNDIDDITSLKITTYTLKDFTDGDGNTYLPGSKYTKDEDLELDVNYNSEDHYNEIELPIPVKQGYKFEYWTLDGERIDEYTPKTNKTLVTVWTEIKYNFIDGTDNVNYEEESEDKVIFITDGIIENFKNLYVNGKRLEKGEDYTLDGNKIVLTEKGKEYLDSLEPGEYEVKAEFADSNDYVYGIIKVSEKEVVPEDEPQDNPEEDEPKDNPIIPKTSDYILFTVIIALTALISSIFVYKKIEY